MPRALAITWNARLLRYVHTDADRQGRLHVVDAGEQDLAGDAETAAAIVSGVQQLVAQLKAEKSRLLILMNRGSVDSATFTVPPAGEDELPLLVQNLAIRDIPGATDQTPVDFIAYPQRRDGTRAVSAMALVAEDHLLVRQVMQQSGCRAQRVLVSTHSLRAYAAIDLPAAAAEDDAQESSTLIISRGDDVADVLLCAGPLPLLSRTIRLAPDAPQTEITRYLCTETQRMLISAGSQLAQPARITRVVAVGNARQMQGFDTALAQQFQVDVQVVRPTTLLTAAEDADPLTQTVDSGSFAPLLAAAAEDAASVVPAIDFANPRRPPVRTSPARKMAALVVAAALLPAAAGWYVWSQFREIDDENQRLVERLNELNQLVKDTAARRQLAATLTAWEKNRISWPDELRDLTMRIPSSPDLVVQQLSIASAGPGTAVATFRGVGKQPEIIAQMETKLRDKYHEIRIPAVREQQDGNKITAAFQATLTIRSRPTSAYSGLLTPPDAEHGKAGPRR